VTRAFYISTCSVLGTLAPARELPTDGSKSDIATANIMYFLTNLNLVVPVVAALAVIVIAIAVICVLRSRQNNNTISKGNFCAILFFRCVFYRDVGAAVWR
jgi:hypothetical protein